MFIVSKALLIVVSLYVLCFSVNESVCFVCCVFDTVCVLFGETRTL